VGKGECAKKKRKDQSNMIIRFFHILPKLMDYGSIKWCLSHYVQTKFGSHFHMPWTT